MLCVKNIESQWYLGFERIDNAQLCGLEIARQEPDDADIHRALNLTCFDDQGRTISNRHCHVKNAQLMMR